MIPVLVVAGPTASGKTELALRLAEELSGEIISADSRQVYKGLDAGTAKPDPAQRRRVKHHLLDLIAPAERYSAGSFARDAAGVIEALSAAGVAPLVCGGTGFYIEALLRPFFREPLLPPGEKEALRREFKARAESLGAASIHRELVGVDPSSAARLHPHDFQRVSRALELYRLTGRTMTELLAAGAATSRFAPLTVILDPAAAELKAAIAGRSRRMLESGWPEEVQSLLASGVPAEAPGFQSLGYREVLALVEGRLTLDETLDAVISHTWHYARRQRTWFRKRPARLRLVSGNVSTAEISSLWRVHRAEFK